MRNIYRLNLTSEERSELTAITRAKRVAATKVLKAQALLLADESSEGKAWSDRKIIDVIDIKPDPTRATSKTVLRGRAAGSTRTKATNLVTPVANSRRRE